MKKNVEIRMMDSFEARPIALLVQTANQFDSQIYLEVDEKRVNVKSIMGMMSLALLNGTEVSIDVEGADAEKAMVTIDKFLTGKEI